MNTKIIFTKYNSIDPTHNWENFIRIKSFFDELSQFEKSICKNCGSLAVREIINIHGEIIEQVKYKYIYKFNNRYSMSISSCDELIMHKVLL